MEASGKGNCMLASKNTLNYLTLLIPLSAFLYVSYSQAQQQSAQADATDSRRIERLGEVSTEEWEMDLLLPSEAPAITPQMHDFVLPDEEQNQRLKQLLSKLAKNQGDADVLAQLDKLMAEVLVTINSMLDAGSLDQAEQLFPLIQSIKPNLAGFKTTKLRLKSLKVEKELLDAGEAALLAGQILEPQNSSALYYYSRALDKDPQSLPAQKGMERVQQALIDLALESAWELDFETTEMWLLEASAVRDDQQLIEDARSEVAEFKKQRAIELEQKVLDAMHSGNYVLADFNIIDLMALGGQEDLIKSLQTQLEEVRFYGGFEPGQVIIDGLQSGGSAPEIIVIDAGSFLMGSEGRSNETSDHEEPRHRVIFEHGFGLGVREVTVAEFQLFVTRTGYRTTAERTRSSKIYDESAGRLSKRDGVNWRHDYRGKDAAPDLPVLHVSAADALAYVQWLALETGRGYRLPSEAEYEYVARAGGSSTYWWGEETPAEVVENLTGERDKSPSKREWATYFKRYGDGYWGPAPAGSLANDSLVHPMGVYDIAGNVAEWTADCWHENYIKAPSNGSAWVNAGCERRVVRGGYWASAPEQSRAAVRSPFKAESYGPVVGFRIARNL